MAIAACDIQKEYRDRHKGKMAFVLGAGPSLDNLDETRLAPYITVDINEALFKLAKPDYFFSCDGGVWTYGLCERIAQTSRDIQVILDDHTTMGNKYDGLPPEQIRAVHRKWNKDFAEQAKMRKTDDLLVVGSTSVQPAVHLLHIMGCEPIVLLGCDCCYKEGRYAFWMLPKYHDRLTQPYVKEFGVTDPAKKFRETNHHAPSYDNVSQQDGLLSGMYSWWERIAGQSPDVPIINASLGVLPFFKRMALDDVLKTYGERKK